MSELLKNNQQVMKCWNYEKNKNIDLNNLKSKSSKKVWWICDKCNCEWEMTVAHRTSGQGCPYCSGHKVFAGKNDIFTTHPYLKQEWDYQKNTLNPLELSHGCCKYAYWQCEKGHSYKMRIDHRCSNHGCPYCAGAKILKGYNDLESWAKKNNPQILKKWHYQKNKKDMSDYSKGSREKVWWICDICGYEYKNIIQYEVVNINCPKCSKRNQTSFPEQAIYYYVKKIFEDAINGYKNDDISELDIYIPSIKTGIEYDGERWHKKNKANTSDKVKYNACKKAGIKLIRFMENYDISVHNFDEAYKSSYNCDLSIFNEEIKLFIKKYSNNIDIDIIRDSNEIKKLYFTNISMKSLEKQFPEIANEWDYEKNKPILPSMVTAKTNEQYYFKCDKGHSYKMSVEKKTRRNYKCPYCSNKRILEGYNDLATTHPYILEEWDYEKNIVLPSEIRYGYNKKVWWICKKCKKSFCSSPASRIINNNGCKYCNGGVSKKVNQYDINGKYLETYESCAMAGKKYNISHSNISRSCLTGMLCNNFQWRYLNDINNNFDNIGPYKKKSRSKKIAQYSIDGKLIKIFDSLTKAAEESGAKSISDVCKGKRQTSGGFKWKYYNDEKE